MTITQKIVGAFGIVLVLLLAMTVVGMTQLMPLQSGYQERNETMLDRTSTAAEIDDAAATMGNYLAVALTDQAPEHRAEYAAMVEEQAAVVRESLDTAKTLDPSPEGLAALAAMEAKFEEYATAVESTLALEVHRQRCGLDKLRRRRDPRARAAG